MGQVIQFFRSNSTKTFKEVFVDNFAPFKNWYLDSAKEHPAEYESDYYRQLLDYLTTNDSINSNSTDRLLVDSLVSEFLGSYCGLSDEGKGLFQDFGPMCYRRYYDDTMLIIAKTKDESFITLWRYLIEGRSIQDSTIDSHTVEEYKTGFFTVAEQIQLLDYIYSYFDMNNIPWVEGQEIVLKRSATCTLDEYLDQSTKLPYTTGTQLILQVLAENLDHQCELVVGIQLG